jgi:hypothetical protein
MRPLLWVSKSTDKLAAILTAGTSEVEQDRALPVLPYHAELGWSRAYGLTDRSAVVELVGTMTTKGAPNGRVRVLRGRL